MRCFLCHKILICLPNPRTQTTIHEKNNSLLPKKWNDDFEKTCECKPFNWTRNEWLAKGNCGNAIS
jgi:hypothetical protein